MPQGRPSQGGHIFRDKRHKTLYRRISVTINGVTRDVFEHRLVAEKMLGRKLLPTEIVHHIDGNGLNNDWANLEITNQSAHMRQHRLGLIKWDLATAIELHGQGFSFEKIAQRVGGGVRWSSIRKAFMARGLPTARRKTNSPKA